VGHTRLAVPKPDGRVRLCGDFKVTVNQAIKVDQYPIPTAQDLHATLAGGKKFSKRGLLTDGAGPRVTEVLYH
jgi:hypothetical protein